MRNRISGMTRILPPPPTRRQQQGFPCLVKMGLMWQLSQIKRNVWPQCSTPGLLCHGFATALKPTPPTIDEGWSRAGHGSRSGPRSPGRISGYSSGDLAMSITARGRRWDRGRVGLTTASKSLSEMSPSVEGQPGAFWSP